MKTSYKFGLLMMVSLLAMGCNNSPKVIAPSTHTEDSENGSGIFTTNPATQVTPNSDISFNEDLHKVVVQEVLPTNRYVYLKVKEEGNGQFWIATRKQEAKKGEVYFYKRPLLKTNFESKEYNRVFDTIYLVSNLVSQDHSKHVGDLKSTVPKMEQTVATKEDIPTHTEKLVEHKGTLKISELVKDPKKYEGHTVQISGTCVKVNPNIMERNWLHVQDGSQNDYDLVVTSNTFVPEGSKITIRAVVSLNRDFGAGYTYDLILENGTLVQ
ncbi:GW dipeptide domain-containing protein [Arenibacter echinorum]|uniref:SH3 domain-containing protein n=1 Tax=Arenibacter echinorum TaxID=440515 RepID=A0A327RDH7_9FLAO|nr:GW dipeptide domain-containing protein [Arenibacter echinorum]RAJ13962.1 SH3 domain-containing protein [Arenibacter echinorum]